MRVLIALASFSLTLTVYGEPASFRAGVARVEITPEGPIWLSGYASRTKPSEGVLHPLYAKALALEDRQGHRLAMVTLDVIGIPRTMSDEIGARVAKQYGLERRALLLNASHTHTGPVIWPNLASMFELPPGEEQKLREYQRRLVESVVELVGKALQSMEPVELSYGEGQVGFAVNRREFTASGVRIGVNPNGPVDHSVPVIAVRAQDGRLVAVVFGYACHNTTLTGEHYEISGDYAGFAQSAIEERFPGATALFLALCGGDQNPHPRGTVELARQHGRALAEEVARVLQSNLRPLKPPLLAAYQVTELELAPYKREQFEAELQHKSAAYRNRARLMLQLLDQRRPIHRVAYPVQAFRWDRSLTLVALGGEVVVDYALRLKREYVGEPLIVVGYSNDVMGYIPSERVLREGGYEADQSMVYYGLPAPFTARVEEQVFEAIRRVMMRVGRPLAHGRAQRVW